MKCELMEAHNLLSILTYSIGQTPRKINSKALQRKKTHFIFLSKIPEKISIKNLHYHFHSKIILQNHLSLILYEISPIIYII